MQLRTLEYQRVLRPAPAAPEVWTIGGIIVGCIAAFLAVRCAAGRWSDYSGFLWAVCPLTAASFAFVLPSHAWPWTLGLIIGPFVEWFGLGLLAERLRSRVRRAQQSAHAEEGGGDGKFDRAATE